MHCRTMNGVSLLHPLLDTGWRQQCQGFEPEVAEEQHRCCEPGASSL